ncbi:MAG: hypothetical protein LBE83_02200, partial [Propionibacteriaceae bacterium]|nr:hypothetical protein [Propionibacteriaceae bacterium]
MSSDDSFGPDFTWSVPSEVPDPIVVSQPALAVPVEEPVLLIRAPKKRWPLVATIIVVVALVVAGGIIVRSWSWFGSSAPVGESTQPGSGPTSYVPQQSTGLVDVPIDLTAGLGVSVQPLTVGAWGGVLVFDLLFNSPEDCWERVCYRSILRGVDYLTGAVLWTVDRLPDNTPCYYDINAPASYDDGKLAFTLYNHGEHSRAVVMVIELRTGIVLVSHETPTQGSKSKQFLTYNSAVVTYQDGIIVIGDWDMTNGYDGDTLWVSTVAYRDTNLSTPLWRAEGTLTATDHNLRIWTFSPALPGLALAVSDDHGIIYVAIETGEPVIFPDQTTDPSFVEASGAILQTGSYLDPFSGGVISRWSDSTGPQWSFPLTDVLIREAGCVTTDNVVFRIWDIERRTSVVMAINRETGRQAWAVTHLWDEEVSWGLRWNCTVVSVGDQELVVLPESNGLSFVDGVTGTRVGDLPDLVTPADREAGGDQVGVSGTYPCGDHGACAIVSTGSGIVVTVFDPSTSPPSILNQQRFLGLYDRGSAE